MKHCANPECPDYQSLGRPTEYEDTASKCAECEEPLEAGPAPKRLVGRLSRQERPRYTPEPPPPPPLDEDLDRHEEEDEEELLVPCPACGFSVDLLYRYAKDEPSCAECIAEHLADAGLLTRIEPE